MAHFQYLLDENVDPHLREAIHDHNEEIIVWIVGEPGAPPRGTLDPEILQWCETNAFSLVTKNRASMPVHVAEHVDDDGELSGIFVPSPAMSLGEIASDLILIWEAADPAEFSNQIVYLPI